MNAFEKLKNEIITGAESGFNGGQEELVLEFNPYHELECDIQETDNILENVTAIANSKVLEISGTIAGGEASIKAAAYRAKTLAKASGGSVVNAFNKLIGRSSNINKMMVNVAKKAKDASKALDKSGIPKGLEDYKEEYPKEIAGFISSLITLIETNINALEGVPKTLEDGFKGTGTAFGLLKVPCLKVKTDATCGIESTTMLVSEVKNANENRDSKEIINAVKDKHDAALDNTEELDVSAWRNKVKKDLDTISGDAGAKSVKIDNKIKSLRKNMSKLSGKFAKVDKDDDGEKSTIDGGINEVATAVANNITTLTTVAKFLEKACDKVVTSARKLEAKLPSEAK